MEGYTVLADVRCPEMRSLARKVQASRKAEKIRKRIYSKLTTSSIDVR